MYYNSLTILIITLSVSLSAQVKPHEGNGNADEVIGLPNLQFKLNFRSFSGYLKGSPKKYLHYWFVESQNSTRDPLILWLNGGPGCSSLDGLLTENGPFHLTEDGKIEKNPFSWNNHANVLYLESPPGVGFSYVTDGNLTVGDDETSLYNYKALLHFLEKFPQFVKNPFYISGESYAGIYIPTLALRVIKNRFINFKGFLLGNGITSYDINDSSLFYFAYYHGLIGRTYFEDVLTACCNGDNKHQCLVTRSANEACKELLSKMESDILNGLDIYNLYKPCFGGATNNRSTSARMNTNNNRESVARSNLLTQIGKKTLVIPCTNDTAITSYLNSWDVREALHIPKSVPKWEVCSDYINANYKKTYKSMNDQFLELINLTSNKIKIWIYYGDVDMACNFYGGEWFFDSLNLTVRRERHHWYFNDSNGNKQIGGFAKALGSDVFFTTIRGSGHMVPTDKPRVAYHLYEHFLNGDEL